MKKTQKYPAGLSVAYPKRELNRVSTCFRLLFVLPVWFLLFLLAGTGNKCLPLGAFIILPTLLLILFRQKYPQWWFDWNFAVGNFLARVAAYTLLLTDEYPATDAEQAVHLALKVPKPAKELHRWLPLIKWLLAVPHYIVLSFLHLAVVVVTVIAWFAILFTGRFPKDLFAFVVGVLRWDFRVAAYAFILITDQYPPFSLQP